MGAGYTPSREGSLVYIHVDDVQAAIERVEKAGGTILMPRTGIGEYGFIAHFEDSEGNRVALHSEK